MICTLLTVLSVAPAYADVAPEVGKSLGGYPVCEASAAIVVSCPQEPEESCLLVADNELGDRLFLYEIDTEKDPPVLKKRREIDLRKMLPQLKKRKIKDIEALVLLQSKENEVVVYGSHSRKKTCEIKNNRRIFASGYLNEKFMKEGSIQPVSPRVKDKKHQCRLLFGDEPNAEMQKVCAVIRQAEERADTISGLPKILREYACNADPAFNLEGAVAVPGADGAERVWIGLRSPLVEGKAVLLRQVEGMGEFKFDAVVFADLRGNGIRELTFEKKQVWGIAGPADDNGSPHALWFVDAAMLRHGATIRPFFTGSLPSFSEGLAIHDGNAFVLIDGSDPKSGNPMTCRTESKYIIRRVAD